MDQTPTPLPLSSAQSQVSPLLRSGWDSLLARLPGTSVQLFAVYQIGPAIHPSTSDPHFTRALIALVVVVFPSLASNLSDLLRHYLASRSKQP